jgi:murein DD-endopeptidase MepM/ murein hydrolase activator NlpD
MRRKIILILATITLTILGINSAYAQPEPECARAPWACQDGSGHYPGFPGSNGPGNLPDVQVTGTRINPMFPYGYPGVTLAPGWSLTMQYNQRDPNKPCPGDPFPNPVIAPTGPGKFIGGTFGYTRTNADGTSKFHDGLDLSVVPSTPLYAMYPGEVTMVKNSFAPGEYKANSYGNYVEIRSILGGEIIYLKYNHLDAVASGMTVGTQVAQGQQIGETGTTGNAAYVLFPHLHIQAKDEERNKIDPEQFLRTKLDKSTGAGTNPCLF